MTTIDLGRCPDATPTARTRHWPRVLIVWTVATVVTAALALGFMNFNGIELIWSVPLDAVVLVVACTAMMDIIYAARWRLWLTDLCDAPGFSLWTLWTYVTWSRVASQVLPIPAGSLGVRAAAVKTAGNLSVKRALLSVAIDPVLDLLQFLFVVPMTVAFVLGYVTETQATCGIGLVLGLGAGILVAAFPSLLALMRWMRQRGSAKRVDREDLGRMPRRKTLLTAYALTLARYVFVALRIWAVAVAVGLTDLTPQYALCTGTVTQAAYMATVTPGALGVLEGGWFAVLRTSGYAAADATLFVTAQRLLLWLSLAVITLVTSAVFAATTKRRAKTLGTVANPAVNAPGVTGAAAS